MLMRMLMLMLMLMTPIQEWPTRENSRAGHSPVCC